MASNGRFTSDALRRMRGRLLRDLWLAAAVYAVAIGWAALALSGRPSADTVDMANLVLWLGTVAAAMSCVSFGARLAIVDRHLQRASRT